MNGNSKLVNARVDKDVVQKVLNLRKGSPGFLNASETSAYLKPITSRVCRCVWQPHQMKRLNIAQELGYPVVLKIASPDITHKSDIGGVMLNLVDPEAVSIGFSKIISNTKAAFPQAEYPGGLCSAHAACRAGSDPGCDSRRTVWTIGHVWLRWCGS